MYMKISFNLLALSALTILAGCSGKPPVVPLTGTVKFEDGSPASGAYVIFEGVDRPISATAIVSTDGSFSIRTFGANDGIEKGRYRVAVTPPARDDVNGKLPVMKMDPKYKQFETSGFEFSIESNPKPVQLIVTKK
jgi:hypothetical protein